MNFIRMIPVPDTGPGSHASQSRRGGFGRLFEPSDGTVIGLRKISAEGPTRTLTDLLKGMAERLKSETDKPELSTLMAISSAQYALELYNTTYREAQLSKDMPKTAAAEDLIYGQLNGAKHEAVRITEPADKFIALLLILEVEIRINRLESAIETFSYVLDAFTIAGPNDQNARMRIEAISETCINLVKALSQ